MGSELEFGKYINVSLVLKYIEERRNEDGGYCFISLLDETNINDTYYAVKVHDLLGSDVPEKEKTIDFLYKSTQSYRATVALAMGIEALAILGAKDLARDKVEFIFNKYNPLKDQFAMGLGGSEEFGTATPLEAKEKIKEFIGHFRREEGYGTTQATTTMTYQALFSLIRGLKMAKDKPRYIKALQNPNGGFRRSLELGMSNFQNTYRALKSLAELLTF